MQKNGIDKKISKSNSNVLISTLLIFYALLTSFVINPLLLTKVDNGGFFINLHSIVLYLTCILSISIFCKPFYETKNLIISKKRKILAGSVILCFLIIKIVFVIYAKQRLTSDSLTRFNIFAFVSYCLSGFAEELLFRFLIYSKILKKYLYKIFSIIIVSLLFAICHGQLNLTLIPLFLMGLLYTILYEIWPNFFVIGLFHSLWNVFSCILGM